MRLVVLGTNHSRGEDLNETFAHNATMITVRAFLQQVDVHSAFLHGNLKEEIYMQFPPGFRTGDKSKVCRFRKSVYGLKQTRRYWYAKLVTALKDYGLTQNKFDHSLFTYQKGDNFTRYHHGNRFTWSKLANFPLERHHRADGDLLQNPTRYNRLIGKLIYLGVTMPDLSYVIHILSQFMSAPRV